MGKYSKSKKEKKNNKLKVILLILIGLLILGGSLYYLYDYNQYNKKALKGTCVYVEEPAFEIWMPVWENNCTSEGYLAYDERGKFKNDLVIALGGSNGYSKDIASKNNDLKKLPDLLQNYLNKQINKRYDMSSFKISSSEMVKVKNHDFLKAKGTAKLTDKDGDVGEYNTIIYYGYEYGSSVENKNSAIFIASFIPKDSNDSDKEKSTQMTEKIINSIKIY